MSATNSHEEDSQVSKSEIGWSFVEQYYTFVNTKPEKLHLFYNRSSTLCHGNEGEMVPSYRGQSNIQSRIKEHKFNDCKVVVSNVDCQESANDGVVIQVLGELANRDQPSQKFVQTFFLAPQPTGYFVLNDIFRFLKEDVEEDDDSTAIVDNKQPQPQPQQSQAPAQAPVVSAPSSAPSPAPAPVAATAPSQSPDAVTAPTSTPPQPQKQPTQPNGSTEDKSLFTEKKQPEQKAPQKQQATTGASEAAAPTPKSSKQQQSKESQQQEQKEQKEQKSSQSPVPSGPVSWAAKLKATNKKSEANGAEKPSASASPEQTQVQPQQPVQTPTPAATPKSNNQQAPANGSKKPNYAEFHSAYIKHVSHRVDEVLLERALSNIGKMTHFQVEKSKNCAFVDWIDEETLQRALSVHELKVGDQTVLIEVRKRGGAKNKKNGNGNGSGNSNNGPRNVTKKHQQKA